MTKKILLVSGETSGDQQAAKLVNEIRAKHPSMIFLGMGGNSMKAAGVNILVDAKKLAVVGILEVITALPRILKAYLQLKRCLKKEKPDLVILIDYPGFNLRFARTAKRAGCKVMYYITPQIWAWGENRIHWFKRYVDQACVIFPFETAFYRKHGVKAHFVGHPLTQHAHPLLTQEKALAHFKIENRHPIIGLLPGSRTSEINALLPVLLKLAQLIHQHYPTAQFILPIAPHLDKELFTQKIKHDSLITITLTQDYFYDALSMCDLAVAASGTATLECALLEIPTLLIYKLNPLTYWIAKKISNQKHLGICNIITQDIVMKELIQKEANPEKIFEAVKPWIENKHGREEARLMLGKVKLALTTPTEGTAAEHALQLIATDSC